MSVRHAASESEIEVIVRWATTAIDQPDGFAPLSALPTDTGLAEPDEGGYGHGV